jgi:hypothetical protein
MAEQLERLKRRLGITSNDQDALLTDLITDAENYIVAYSGRARMPAPLASVVTELAAAAYNRRGNEGETSHSEGRMSWSIEGLPAHLKLLLNRYRVGRV